MARQSVQRFGDKAMRYLVFSRARTQNRFPLLLVALNVVCLLARDRI